MKQHKRKKHEISQINGNDSISEDNLQEGIVIEKCGDNVKKKNYNFNNTVIVENLNNDKKVNKIETTIFDRDELWCWNCEEEEGSTLDRWLYQYSNKPAMKAHMHNEHQITTFEDIHISKHEGFKYFAY